MARGNWRNWEETTCSGCGNPMYIKQSKRLEGEKYCSSCFKKAEVKSIITSIEDLPIYIKKYARIWKNTPNDIIIIFPYPTEITEVDIKAIPITKKFIRVNGGGYDDKGHWYIPLSRGKGWHESPDASGKAPEHVQASIKTNMNDLLRRPMINYKQPWEMTRKELWMNQEPHQKYVEGSDATTLIGKHYLMYNCFQKEVLNEVSLIPISKIKKTSEDIKYKCPQYKNIKTQAPPVHVSIEQNETYRLFDGHRRLVSAKCRGEEWILAEIHHAKSHKEIVEQAKRNGYNIPLDVQRDYPELFGENT